jgi:hypothetical protein
VVRFLITGKVTTTILTSPPLQRSPCPPTLYAVDNTPLCTSCPTGATCDGSGNLKSATGNVWRPDPSHLPLITCNPKLQGCATAGSTDPSACRPGYKGFMCAQCDSTLNHYAASRGCAECSSSVDLAGKIIMIVLVIAATILLGVAAAPCDDAGGLARTVRREKFVSCIKFFFNFFSIMGLLTLTDAAQRLNEIGWGTLDFEGFVSGATFFRQLYWACGFSTYNAETQWSWAGCTFLTLLAISLIPITFRGLKRPSEHSFWFYIASGIAVTLHLSYTSLIATSFRVMDTCDIVQFELAEYVATGGANHAGFGKPPSEGLITYFFLHSDPSIVCKSASNAPTFVGGVLCVVIACVLLPALLCLLHRRIAATVDRETAKNVFFYFSTNYKNERWYWEYILFGQKFFIALCITLAPQASELTLLSALFAVNLYLNERMRPFSTEKLAQAESFVIAAAFLTVTLLAVAEQSEHTVFIGVLIMLVHVATFMAVLYSVVKYTRAKDDEGTLLPTTTKGNGALDTGLAVDEDVPRTKHGDHELQTVNNIHSTNTGGYGGI